MEVGKLLFGHLKALIKASKKFNEQGVSIRRRLVLYWVSMVLALFLIFILVLNLIGTFSKTERELSAFLELQERNTSAALSNHLSELTAQGIILSKEISKKMSNLLNDRGVDFDELNDNISLIAELEGDLYDSVYTTLNAGDCNGAFVLLDATANTGLDGSEKSRIGCYLRYSDVSTAGSSNQRLTYFRGMFDIARKNGVQLHNRWNPEFDTSFCRDMMILWRFRLIESRIASAGREECISPAPGRMRTSFMSPLFIREGYAAYAALSSEICIFSYHMHP